jgi:hypothetical protein
MHRSIMTDMLTDEEMQIEKSDQERILPVCYRGKWCEDREKWIQQYLDKITFSKVRTPMPSLEWRILERYEIETLKEACLKELHKRAGWNAQATLKVIDEFVQFCTLLSKPENHIQVPSMQYVEKQINARQYVDMEKEMSHELSRLPERTAYIRVNREKNGEREVLIRKIKTLQLTQPRLQGGDLAELRGFIEFNMKRSGYVKERNKIEEEIRLRQEKWRSQIPESTRRIPPSEEPPPPTSYS